MSHLTTNAELAALPPDALVMFDERPSTVSVKYADGTWGSIGLDDTTRTFREPFTAVVLHATLLTTLRAEVERLRAEASTEADRATSGGVIQHWWIGRQRGMETILDLIDKHTREGQ